MFEWSLMIVIWRFPILKWCKIYPFSGYNTIKPNHRSGFGTFTLLVGLTYLVLWSTEWHMVNSNIPSVRQLLWVYAIISYHNPYIITWASRRPLPKCNSRVGIIPLIHRFDKQLTARSICISFINSQTNKFVTCEPYSPETRIVLKMAVIIDIALKSHFRYRW